jgi:hypothetical protein
MKLTDGQTGCPVMCRENKADRDNDDDDDDDENNIGTVRDRK